MNKAKKIAIILLNAIFLLSLTPVVAEDLLTRISVVLNSVTLYVNGEQVTGDSIVYNNTVYVPVKTVSERLGLDVEWNTENKRIDITDNRICDKLTDEKHKIIHYSPKLYEDDAYLINDFTYIQFDDEISKDNDYSNIVFMDIAGNQININCNSDNLEHKDFLYIVPEALELDTYYTLFIPKNTVYFTNGDVYHEDIQMIFKTAKNVLEGRINSPNDCDQLSIRLYNNNDYENTEYILEDNRFYFTDIPAGIYSIEIDDAIFDNIIVESNKINYVNLMKIE